jgi:hypothetical protein
MVELLLGGTIMVILLGLTQSVYQLTARSTVRSNDSSDALRSALLATEVIRQDLRRLVFQQDQDLVLPATGRGVSMIIPDRMGRDLWQNSTTPVTYSLEAVHDTAGPFRLIREDRRGRRPVLGCLLKNLNISYVPVGQLTPLQAYLEVTATGLGSTSSRASRTVTTLVPVNRITLPDSAPEDEP